MTRLCLFGAAPNTSNLGVSALFHSVAAGLVRQLPDLELTVFDYGKGVREGTFEDRGQSYRIRLISVFNSRRYHRCDNLWNVRICNWMGGRNNPVACAIRQATAVLDLSGGDSFTDLYGAKRFGAITLPKQIVLEAGRPLVLLPQTYGPFAGSRARRLARRLARGAHSAWARDPQSFDRLRELLGTAYDPQRHRQGVDLAFAMDACLPPQGLPDPLGRWLEEDHPLVGLNVSGLLSNQPAVARQQYGFRADYQQVIQQFAQRLLTDTNCRLVFVPHVVTPPGHYESDVDACNAVIRQLSGDNDRVACVPIYADPRHVKSVISRFEWFCGTRMHATIAALSSGVPSAAISYSDKTLGVFETCNQASSVVDPRVLDTEAVVERLWQIWNERDTARHRLMGRLPAVIQCAQAQIKDVVEMLSLGNTSAVPLIESCRTSSALVSHER